MVSVAARHRFMKIMRRDSWSAGCAARPKRATMRQAPALRPALFTGDLEMQWETPTAIDFRFGFEITLYVAAR
jgi:coenzyme PQQ precursor peptide PqqA